MVTPLTKEFIAEEALTLLKEEGLEGLSMRKLASRLGVQAATLYYHVPDKSALQNELLLMLFEKCVRIMPETQSWQEWMRAFGRAIWKVQKEVPAAPLLIANTKIDAAHFERSVAIVRNELLRFEGDQEELLFLQSAIQAMITGWSTFAHSAYADRMARVLEIEELAFRSVDSIIRGWEDRRPA